MTNLCLVLRCLPGPGGLLDQDGYMVFLMRAVLRVRDEKRQLDEEKQAQHIQRAQARAHVGRR